MVLQSQETALTKAERLLRGPLAHVLVNGGESEGDEAGQAEQTMEDPMGIRSLSSVQSKMGNH